MYYISRTKDIKHVIILIGAEKAFDKIQNPFMMKTFNTLGVEGNFFNLIKAVANIILKGEKLNTFHLKSGIRKEYPFIPL